MEEEEEEEENAFFRKSLAVINRAVSALSEYLSRVASDNVSVVVISSLFPCYIRHMVKRELLRALAVSVSGDPDPQRHPSFSL